MKLKRTQDTTCFLTQNVNFCITLLALSNPSFFLKLHYFCTGLKPSTRLESLLLLRVLNLSAKLPSLLFKFCMYIIDRGSYMSAHVLLNLLNEVGETE